MTTSSTGCAVRCEPRWATQRTDRPTYGEVAVNFADELGFELMPWQRQVLDVALEYDPDTGKLAYREVVLTVPRQSGKTTLLLVLIMWRCLFWDRQVTVYTAQTGADARAKWFDDWLPLLEHSAFARFFKPRKATGSEALIFHNGSRQHLIATSDSSGHGKSVDMAILDEVFSYSDARLEQAMKPAMMTRDQPQLWVVSTAGTAGDSPYLWGKVENGRLRASAGLTEGLCYFEWSADEKLDPSASETWRSCMPALGHTVSEDAVRADYLSMAPAEFRRAYLNQWTTQQADPIIPLERWAKTVDDRGAPVGPVSFAFDVSPDRASAAIAVAGARSDGLVQVEVVEHRSGTGWVVQRLAELKERWHPAAIMCDPGGPAGSLLPDLAKLGVELETVNAREHAQACGLFYDLAMADTPKLRHRDQPIVVSALDGAKKRPLGDAWAWSRQSSSVDICPLVAETLAVWAHEQHRPKAVVPQVISLAAALTGG